MAYPDGVTLTGLVGSYIMCPDSAALDLTGDFEVVVRAALTNWKAGTIQSFLAKFDGPSGSGRAYVARLVATTGVPQITWNDSGTATVRNLTGIGPAPSFTNGNAAWMKFEFDANDGAGNAAAFTYTSADQVGEPSSWSLLGSSSVATTATIATGSYPLVIGSDNTATRSTAGKFYRVILRNAIGGSVVADFDSRLSGPTGYTDAYGNTWTIVGA